MSVEAPIASMSAVVVLCCPCTIVLELEHGSCQGWGDQSSDNERRRRLIMRDGGWPWLSAQGHRGPAETGANTQQTQNIRWQGGARTLNGWYDFYKEGETVGTWLLPPSSGLGSVTLSSTACRNDREGRTLVSLWRNTHFYRLSLSTDF